MELVEKGCGARSMGARVMAQVGCERDAREAILAGADVVVAESRACRAERRVLEFYSFVTREFLTKHFLGFPESILSPSRSQHYLKLPRTLSKTLQ